jgi:hypothetical protein
MLAIRELEASIPQFPLRLRAANLAGMRYTFDWLWNLLTGRGGIFWNAPPKPPSARCFWAMGQTASHFTVTLCNSYNAGLTPMWV